MVINLHNTLYKPIFQALNVIVIKILSAKRAVAGEMPPQGTIVESYFAEMLPKMGEIGKKRLIL